MKKYAAAFLVLSLSPFLGAKDKTKPQQAAPAPAVRTLQAVRTEEPIAIDGRLVEKAWQGTPAEGFTQNDPNDGSQATERTEVWIAYDDKALYVAALCRDSDPKGIRSLLGRRDSEVDSDWFRFAVDPYLDRRTGYEFSVNPAGSIGDSVLSNDVNDDSSWDGIWESKAALCGEGWIVEMKIPFNQLRFPRRDEYVWGVNFRRIIKRKNETVSYAWVPKTETAFVSRFAHLEGIRGISPGRHIEIIPYTVGQAQFRPSEAGNPFETGSKYAGNLGFDAKVGLLGNLTLDASVNPDFGQVEVDPAVINLSAYETYYEEKRPFFIEGASLFDGFGRGGVYMNMNINWPSPSFFYSRRIGRAPQGYATHDGFVSTPDRSTILGAAKITGKVGGWNVGFINALTAREFAEVDGLGVRARDEVEPLTYYGVLRAQKDIAEGQGGIGFIATGVARDLDDPTLAGILNKNAFSLAVDGWKFFDKARNWVLGGWVGGTRVEGSTEDIHRLQRSSMHYFQRPDATHVEADPGATSLSGWGGRLNLAKQNGDWLFLASLGALSPGFDPNDMGFQYSGSDKINLSVVPARQWAKPGKVFRYFLIAPGVFQNYDFQGNKTWEGALGMIQGQLRNFWRFNFMTAVNPCTVSNTQTRGGPLALVPWGYQFDLSLETDSRQPVVCEGGGTIYRRPESGTEWSAEFAIRWKPRSNVSVSVGPLIGRETTLYQWVMRVPDPLMTSTFGTRYVFAHLDQKTVAAEIRLNLTFTPRLTLQGYLQPFVAVGAYDGFKELARPKSLDYNRYGENGSTVERIEDGYLVDPDGAGPAEAFTLGNPDFNYKSLRGTIVLRWEYRPGSLLYFVWTQNRADFAHAGELRLGRDLGDLFTAPGDNIFLVKFSYRWNM